MEFDFYAILTPEQRTFADRCVQRADYAKGQIVHRHGDACVGVILVREGSLRVDVLSEEGREITLFQAEPGDCCVLSAACVLHSLDLESQVTAETAAQVDILPAASLARLMSENKELEREIFKQATTQYAHALRTMERIVFFSLAQHVDVFQIIVQRDGACYGLLAVLGEDLPHFGLFFAVFLEFFVQIPFSA